MKGKLLNANLAIIGLNLNTISVYILRKGGIAMAAVEKASVSDSAAVSAPNQESAVRKYFPETWIWDCGDARLVSRGC